LLSKSPNNPELVPFELTTYSDGTTNYETGSVVHQSLNMSNATIACFIVGGITYYQTWYEVSNTGTSSFGFNEIKYNSESGVKTQVSNFSRNNQSTSANPIAYWDLRNA